MALFVSVGFLCRLALTQLFRPSWEIVIVASLLQPSESEQDYGYVQSRRRHFEYIPPFLMSRQTSVDGGGGDIHNRRTKEGNRQSEQGGSKKLVVAW